MLDDYRQATLRQRTARAVRRLQLDCRRLLSEKADLGGLALARQIVARLDELDDEQLDGFFDFLHRDLSPDPARALAAAQAYAELQTPQTLAELVAAAEPARQELLRRLNRVPGGTAAALRLRRALFPLLKDRPELAGIDADLLHLLSSWFNPGFLQMRRVDWNAPAQLLERLIQHEAVHAIDGWDDLRRRLQADRRCFAFFHPQLGDEPLIFVEVALLPEMPDAIAPLIDKASTPRQPDRFKVAAFYSISNCESGLRGVSLGNFLIKTVAQQLQRELPQLKRFCTLSPIPGFARWLLAEPDFAQLPGATRAQAQQLSAARAVLRERCAGDLGALQGISRHEHLGDEGRAALLQLCGAYLALLSPTPQGDPVARFHLDNGARLERINPRADLSTKGLRQSFGLMVNYLYDLDKVEDSHVKFRQGQVRHSHAVGTLL